MTARDLAILGAVAAGEAELACGCEPDLFINGMCCCDQFAAHRLARGGLIARAKSDRDTSVYRPQSCTAWRWYADVYQATKVRYGLTITPQQEAGLTELRGGCPR